MGVPAFFRWLSKKYPSLIVHCVEEKAKVIDGVKLPVDTSQPNPNDTEFDNLYLDMNGIIHPCCHPEDRPAPKNEDEMMVLIFEFIDRIFTIVRPRKLLYMAIDGVAPRAKMNQQRSRRFRAAKESVEKREAMARIKAELREKGAYVPPDKPDAEHFDSNCITPGTPFMFRLAECLRYYIHDRLNSDPGWRNVKVILSDANVPGEGEHKIMDYIRRQRAQPDHDPNTHHCLCGADADLIMLGLATHEPHFTIIREEFKPNQPKSCEICGQVGHEMTECAGAPKPKEGEFDELSKEMGAEGEYIFVRLTVLREYLESELNMPNLPFKQDIERAIDDWVFMCFFVGNDFLPHLPSLEIREGAIDRLQKLYKDVVYKTGGYLTDSGVVNLERVQFVLTELGHVEDEIFKQRRQTELEFRRRDKEKKKRMKSAGTVITPITYGEANRPKWMMGGQYQPQAPSHGGAGGAIANPRQTAYQMRVDAMNSSNKNAAAALRSMLTPDNSGQEPHGTKRKAEELEEEEEKEPEDDVKLWEDGWKDRYYESKFDVGNDDIEFRNRVGNEYVIGLCWVLRYYYQGCASWKWYFPYHYAPFASDFLNIGDLPNDFERNTEPFMPLEQLMGVFPAGSKKFLPITWQDLMCNPESPIIDFYPTNFKIDLNGKKYAWQGVALLPFVDETRLKEGVKAVYPDLTAAEVSRNIRGNDRLFVGCGHSSHDFLEALYEGGDMQGSTTELDPKKTEGMRGTVGCDDFVILNGETIFSPVPKVPNINNNRAICVTYKDPEYDPDYLFKSIVLPGAKFPPKSLTADDIERARRNANRGRGRGGGGGFRGRGGGYGDNRGGFRRPQLGFTPNSGYRTAEQKDPSSFIRHLRHNLGIQGNQGGGADGGSGGRQYQETNYNYGNNQRDDNRHGGGNRFQGGQQGGNSRNMQQSDNWGAAAQNFRNYGGGGGGGSGRGGYNNQQGGYQQRNNSPQRNFHQQNYRGGSNRQNYQSRDRRW